MKRGVYMANDTKPSLYEYYLKLVPDTVIFDEIERIACQNGIDCGSFDGKGVINDNGLFFYIDSDYIAGTSIDTNACRLFLKIYFPSDADNDILNDIFAPNITNGEKSMNIIRLNENLLISPKPKKYFYLIIDSEGIIELPDSLYKYTTVVGVKF